MVYFDFEGRKKIDVHLNIAPLIDIVFLLLIFFLLSANFINQTGIKVTLPTARTSQVYHDDVLTIFISQNNELFVEGKLVTLEKLQNILNQELKTRKSRDVIIKADEKIDFGLAVKVMDMAKQAHAEGLVISTEYKKDDE